MKMEQCSETSVYKIQMPGNYPEENIQQVQKSARCEVLTAVLMKNQLFWDVML
jgi:phosphoribosylanthranilate isomerase